MRVVPKVLDGDGAWFEVESNNNVYDVGWDHVDGFHCDCPHYYYSPVGSKPFCKHMKACLEEMMVRGVSAGVKVFQGVKF